MSGYCPKLLLLLGLLLHSGCGVIVVEPSTPREASPPAARPQAPPQAAEPKKSPHPEVQAPPEPLATLPRPLPPEGSDARGEESFVADLNAEIAAADDFASRGETARAGRAYQQILRSLSGAAVPASRLSRPPDALARDLEACSEILMERGLGEYRRGRLEHAIAVWKSILSFDPDHSGARSAVDTTSRQLKALRSSP